MTKLKQAIQLPSTSLNSVSQATIRQFEREPHDVQRLYARLSAQNQELALWLRKRAHELAPDIDEREPLAVLALELAGIIANQQTIDSLRHLSDT